MVWGEAELGSCSLPPWGWELAGREGTSAGLSSVGRGRAEGGHLLIDFSFEIDGSAP